MNPRGEKAHFNEEISTEERNETKVDGGTSQRMQQTRVTTHATWLRPNTRVLELGGAGENDRARARAEYRVDSPIATPTPSNASRFGDDERRISDVTSTPDNARKFSTCSGGSASSGPYRRQSGSRESPCSDRLSDFDAPFGTGRFVTTPPRRSAVDSRSSSVATTAFEFDTHFDEMVREFDRKFERDFSPRYDRLLSRAAFDDDEFLRPRKLRDVGGSLLERDLFSAPRATLGRTSQLSDRCGVDSGVFSDVTESDAPLMTSSLRRKKLARSPDDVSSRASSSSAADKFELEIDVKGFRPNELMVKTEGSRLVVCAQTIDGEGNNIETRRQSVTKKIRREFDLPRDVNPFDVVSSLGPDGLLKVEAPLSRPVSKAGSLT